MTAIAHKKPAVADDVLDYRNLKEGEFWRHVPAYKDIDEATFMDHLWQQKNSVKTPEELLETIKGVCSPEFFADVAEGFAKSPMAVRVPPTAANAIHSASSERSGRAGLCVVLSDEFSSVAKPVLPGKKTPTPPTT